MRESVRVTFVDAGGKVPIEGVSRDGLRLFGETSAWPRRVALRITPRNDATRHGLDDVRRRLGWNRDEIKLAYELRDGEIHLFGVEEDALPSGFWDVGLTVYDVISRPIGPVELPRDGHVAVEIRVANDVKRLAVRDEATWDGEIRRVLAGSELDRRPGAQWIRHDATRANRRACAANILAVCRDLGLIDEMQRLLLTEVDRIYAEVTAHFGERLDDRFHAPRPPGQAIHRRLLDYAPADRRDGYTLASYRQKGNPSLQVVTATPDRDGSPFLAELDIDLGDVLDPFGFLIHTVEVLHPRRTDHLVAVPGLLRGTGVEAFLPYDLV